MTSYEFKVMSDELNGEKAKTKTKCHAELVEAAFEVRM